MTPTDPAGREPWNEAPLWDGVEPWAAPRPSPADSGDAAASTAPTTRVAVRRRPVVMGIAGLFAGVGVALLLIHFARIAVGTSAPVVVIVIGVAVAVVLAYTLPARRSRRTR